ncbi:hypothetical protein NC653_039331 [Populus alba x Populus x berolinensis]|uniref:Uncharacterized protein n=1 Tax=Populus alba x Populus x berolinensis TaxID=444605 RepID=A0AAD6PQF9_9ROSI|nr:hypothetical protein NC653_039331 [Populus alba x Populus x berolinensis]
MASGTPEPIRQLEIVKDGFQQHAIDATSFRALPRISFKRAITASDMVPNLDLILLASLYGCFIACVVGAIIFAILNALLLAFSLTLFSIAIIDLQDLFSFVSRFAVSLKENLELGFALLVCTAMYYAIGAMMASKPVFQRMVSEFKVKARHVLSHLEVLATSC